eukprot:2667680-Prymnesium_polylepis.2
MTTNDYCDVSRAGGCLREGGVRAIERAQARGVCGEAATAGERPRCTATRGVERSNAAGQPAAPARQGGWATGHWVVGSDRRRSGRDGEGWGRRAGRGAGVARACIAEPIVHL